MDFITLLAQASQQTVETVTTIGDMDSRYMKATLLLAILAVAILFLIFQRQKQIAKNQVDIAKLIDELISKK